MSSNEPPDPVDRLRRRAEQGDTDAQNQLDEMVNRLVGRAIRGETDARDQLVDLFYEQVFRYAYKLLRHNEQDAEDATQDVFCQALLKLESVETSFTGWLFRIARNHCIKMAKKRDKQATPSLEEAQIKADPSPGPSALLERAEEALALNQAIEALPEGDKEVVHLRYYAG
jgi:RNA polymerase sigma-70 factor (ECF subfamily)